MGFPAKPPSANRSRPSRRPHADPSIQPIRISFDFFNGQQWWTTSCSSSMADAHTSRHDRIVANIPHDQQAD
ncbi:hypothetical protein ACLOJK_004823, partial [Asimina triloba]